MERVIGGARNNLNKTEVGEIAATLRELVAEDIAPDEEISAEDAGKAMAQAVEALNGSILRTRRPRYWKRLHRAGNVQFSRALLHSFI
jgi:hypothetical protein